MKKITIAAIVLAFATTAVAADDWRDRLGMPENGSGAARCAELPQLPEPRADKATPAETTALKDCDSLALYEGWDKAPDYVAARKCAYLQHTSMPTIDDMVLMMIYANGRGVPKNLPLARQLACSSSWAPAELDLRMQHLDALENGEKGSAPIHVCDDITSGAMQNVCASVDSGHASAKLNASLDALGKRWPPGALAAYASLRKAAADYADTAGNNEGNGGGTAGNAMGTMAADALADEFLVSMRDFAAGRFPASPGDPDADAKLNTEYSKALAEAAEENSDGTTKEEYREAERAWLRYRDAWLAFARAAKPGVDTTPLLRALTSARTKRLTEGYF